MHNKVEISRQVRKKYIFRLRLLSRKSISYLNELLISISCVKRARAREADRQRQRESERETDYHVMEAAGSSLLHGFLWAVEPALSPDDGWGRDGWREVGGARCGFPRSSTLWGAAICVYYSCVSSVRFLFFVGLFMSCSLSFQNYSAPSPNKALISRGCKWKTGPHLSSGKPQQHCSSDSLGHGGNFSGGMASLCSESPDTTW